MEHEAIQLIDTLDASSGLRPAAVKVAPGTHGITPAVSGT